MRVVADCGTVLGESPVWVPAESALLWLDLAQPMLHRVGPDAIATSWPIPLADPLGGLVLLDEPGAGALFAGGAVHRIRLADGTIGAGEPLPVAGGTHVNDAKADRSGRLWATTADDDETAAVGALIGPTPAGLAILDDGFVVGNGPAFSPDGGIVYVSDSLDGTVLRYRLRHDGTLGRREVLADITDGIPDGIAVDADGGLWVALWDGAAVVHLDPHGRELGRIAVPARNVTSVAFGGADLATLFITTATLDVEPNAALGGEGALFALEPGVVGAPEIPAAWPW